jgi:hypothetical protein
VGPSVRPGKRKRKRGHGSVLGQKVLARLKAQPGSAWLHGSARPAAQQVGSVLGLARRVGQLGLTGRPIAHHSPPLSLTKWA